MPTPEILAAFQQLFRGQQGAHGVYQPKTDRSFTKREPPTKATWLAHFAGTVGLGIVPICQADGDGRHLCWFGAVDVDVHGGRKLDLSALSNEIAERDFPLYCCRSKSGGAHLYYFSDEGVEAYKLQRALRFWASQLALGDCEVFPKQISVTPEGVGNWLNLPYFGTDTGQTDRPCILAGEPLDLAGFVQSAKALSGDELDLWAEERPNTPRETPYGPSDTIPPCLVQLIEQGVSEGDRNNALFNFAVFERRRHGEGCTVETVETFCQRINHDLLRPPLPAAEVKTIAKSAAKGGRDGGYGYKCCDRPLAQLCQRDVCLRRRHGVTVSESPMVGAQGAVFGCLRKVTTEPPTYYLSCFGREVKCGLADLLCYQKLEQVVCGALDLIPPRPKDAGVWRNQVRDLLATIEVVEAPPETRLAGRLAVLLDHYLDVNLIPPAEPPIQVDSPRWDGLKVLVAWRHLARWLARNSPTGEKIQDRDVWLTLRNMGWMSGAVRKTEGKNVKFWESPENWRSDGEV